VRRGRILIVDDSVGVRREIVQALSSTDEFEIPRECEEGFGALKVLGDFKPDVVICDLVMPGLDGVGFLRLKAARPDVVHVPVLMLTSADDTNRKVELLERGAADYVTKPFHPRELLARVRTLYRQRVLQEELEIANLKLYELSCTDALTSVFNRRHFNSTLEAEVSRHQRYGTPVSLILVDVDHFKSVNDRFGHAVGDSVLRDIADTLRRVVRKADVVARYGGEELAVILTNTGEGGALILAERLRSAVERLDHRDQEGRSFRTTASFGLASLEQGGESTSTDAILGRADEALYVSKKTGRNRVAVWKQQTAA
jgi:two-component system, cell cycle response regulator